eukprot:TRINITY_DN4413_c0_g1_i6.p1 TRINITY_DN4413_c0_g1~~TRINITY_DN4413_c0_g1_i6.p1  ORF type:complete len:105 (+),score=30.84 TRINITY_DN4413_c0_g1_i6:23-337(+)
MRCVRHIVRYWVFLMFFFFFFQAEDGIRDAQESRGLGDVYKRQPSPSPYLVAPGSGSVVQCFGDELNEQELPAGSEAAMTDCEDTDECMWYQVAKPIKAHLKLP